MGIVQSTECFDHNQQYSHILCEPPGDQVTLTMLTGLLDAALHMWDQDRITAKARIRAAADMLRGAVADVGEEASRGRSRGLAPWQARKVTEFIQASLKSKIRVQDCAKQTRLSVSHFSVAFKVTFGVTVGEYIRHRRIERAQRLMLLSTMSLSQIGLAVGFSDQAHYCRVFRGIMGISPNAWRHRNLVLTPADRTLAGDLLPMQGSPCG